MSCDRWQALAAVVVAIAPVGKSVDHVDDHSKECQSKEECLPVEPLAGLDGVDSWEVGDA